MIPAGPRPTFHPAVIVSWQEFKSAHPDGQVLSRETGYNRSYGRNPYTGYDDVDNSPFLYVGPETPGALPPVARVLTVDLKGETVAYPYLTLEDVQVVNDEVGGQPVVVINHFWFSWAAFRPETRIYQP